MNSVKILATKLSLRFPNISLPSSLFSFSSCFFFFPLLLGSLLSYNRFTRTLTNTPLYTETVRYTTILCALYILPVATARYFPLLTPLLAWLDSRLARSLCNRLHTYFAPTNGTTTSRLSLWNCFVPDSSGRYVFHSQTYTTKIQYYEFSPINL